MRILSLDPSSTCTGFAVLDVADNLCGDPQFLSCGTIKSEGALEERLDRLRVRVGELADDRMDWAVFEQVALPYPGRGMSQAAWNAYSWAVHTVQEILLTVMGPDRVRAVTALTWKKSVKKAAMVKRANLLFGLDLKAKDHDIAEALLLGKWFIERQRVNPLPPVMECTL
jgi:Holliday junction resolvasome RuvABC endonuclease subunit